MNEQQLREQLDAIYRSTSWKITSPLRWIGEVISRGHVFVPKLKQIVIQLARLAARNPTLLQIGTRVISVFPSIRHRLRIAVFMGQYKLDDVDVVIESDINNVALTPAAHEISQQLFSAINSSNIKNKKNYSCE